MLQNVIRVRWLLRLKDLVGVPGLRQRDVEEGEDLLVIRVEPGALQDQLISLRVVQAKATGSHVEHIADRRHHGPNRLLVGRCRREESAHRKHGAKATSGGLVGREHEPYGAAPVVWTQLQAKNSVRLHIAAVTAGCHTGVLRETA